MGKSGLPERGIEKCKKSSDYRPMCLEYINVVFENLGKCCSDIDKVPNKHGKGKKSETVQHMQVSYLRNQSG